MYVAKIVYILTECSDIFFYPRELKEIKYLTSVPSTKPDASLLPFSYSAQKGGDPALMYGAETWATTKSQERARQVNEMRMLQWMCGVTKKDKIRNEHVRGSVKV